MSFYDDSMTFIRSVSEEESLKRKGATTKGVRPVRFPQAFSSFPFTAPPSGQITMTDIAAWLTGRKGKKKFVKRKTPTELRDIRRKNLEADRRIEKVTRDQNTIIATLCAVRNSSNGL